MHDCMVLVALSMGLNACLTEVGYQEVAVTLSCDEMKAFIHRLRKADSVHVPEHCKEEFDHLVKYCGPPGIQPNGWGGSASAGAMER